MKNRFLKYLKILLKGINGISVELIYVCIIVSLAFFLNLLIYFSMIKK